MTNLNRQFKEDLLQRVGELRLTAFPGKEYGGIFDDVDAADAWAAEQNEERNLYYHLNRGKGSRAKNKRLREAHLTQIVGFVVDHDPPRKDLAGGDLEAWREATLAELRAHDRQPTYRIDSGRGFQSVFLFREPENLRTNGKSEPPPAEILSLYKGKAKRLGAEFGSSTDEVAFSLDHVWRWPGVVNHKTGREAAVLDHSGVYFDSGDFPSPARPLVEEQRSGEYAIPDGVTPRESTDGLHPATERTLGIIQRGFDAAEVEGIEQTDRSSVALHVCCDLLRGGHDADDLAAVLLADPTKLGIGHYVRFKRVNGEFKERTAAEREREVSRAVAKAVAAESKQDELAELNENFAVVLNLGGRCRVVREVYNEALDRHILAKFTFEDFRNQHLNREVMVPCGTDKDGNPKLKPEPLGHWWLKHPQRRQFDKVIFLPGRYVPGAYNLWRSFSTEPAAGELHQSYLDHLYSNVCLGNREHFTFLLNWMAHIVQFPDRRIGIAVILRGRQGTGKSFFAKHFGKLFGRHFYHVTSPKHVVGNFNSHLRDVLVLFADECFVPGNKEHASALKGLITEETLTIEAKGIDAELAANFVNVIMASNDDWVAEVEADDRRLFIVDIGEEHAKDRSYFGAIARDLESGGYGHLLHFLLERDLSGFDAQRQLPETRAKDDQKNLRALRSEGAAREFRFLRDGGPLPGSSFVTKDNQLFIETKALAEYQGTTQETVGRFLTTIGGTPFRPRLENGGRPHGYLLQTDLALHRETWKRQHPDRVAIRWPETAEWQLEAPDPPF